MRNLVLVLTGALALAALAGLGQSASAQEANAPRPNIVVVMADDLDNGSVEAMMDLDMMPNLERYLVAEGITFTNAFVTNSLCCPSRATFLTGQYSHNTGVLTNHPPDGGAGVFDDRRTLATWLQAAGYRTSHVGKYLNGYGTVDHTGDGSVDAADLAYVPPGWTDWQGLSDAGLSTYRVYNYIVNDNGSLVWHGEAPEEYQTDVLARRAVRFVDESDALDDETPFFLAVMPLAPHVEVIPGITRFSPYPEIWKWDIRPAPRHRDTVTIPLPIPPSFNEADMSDKPVWLQPGQPRHRPRLTLTDIWYLTRQYRHRLESLRAVDDLLGALFDVLRETDELERTVVVFTSDNGFLYGEHRMAEKLVAYEESIRVPLYVRAPGTTGGAIREQLVLNNDLAPTIAEMAEAVPDLAVDGTSFVPLLYGGAAEPWRSRFLVEHWEGASASVSVMDVPTYAGVRARWRSPYGPVDVLYVEYENADPARPPNSPELYDLALDPYQMRSLHADATPVRVLQREILSGFLAELATCGGGSCAVLEF